MNTNQTEIVYHSPNAFRKIVELGEGWIGLEVMATFNTMQICMV